MTLNLLDRLIGALAPAAGLRRARARAALRVYAGVQTGPRRTIRRQSTSPHTAIAPDLAKLREASRALVRDTPHGARMVSVFASHAVGTGIVPVSMTGSPKIDQRVMRLWDNWQGQACTDGEMTFYGLQLMAVRTIFESGDALLRFIPADRSVLSGRAALQLMMQEGDYLDISHDTLLGWSSGPRQRLGVELGEYDRRLGYWVWPTHPADGYVGLSSLITRDLDRGPGLAPLPQARLVYQPLRLGQVRGVPVFAPVLTTAEDYRDLLDATVVKSKVEASVVGTITSEDDEATSVGAEKGKDGASEMHFEPGKIFRLKPNEHFDTHQASSQTAFGDVSLHSIQAMAAGVGLTYDQVSGDLRQANYSSLRAGKIEHRRIVEQFQWLVLVPMLCQPTWDAFVEYHILAGALPSRAGGYPCRWVTPAWEPIDPEKDLRADILAVRSARMSPQNFIASWGADWRVMLAEHREFWAEADAAGLAFDSDGRRPANGGTPPTPAADEAAKKADNKADDIAADSEANSNL